MQLFDDFKSNLYAGLRLAAFKSCTSTDFKFSLNQFVLLLVLDLTLEITKGYFLSLPEPSFVVYGLARYSWDLVCLFSVAYFLAILLKRTASFLELCIVLYSYVPLTFFLLLLPDELKPILGNTFEKQLLWLTHGLSLYLLVLYWRAISLVAQRKRITLPVLFVLIIVSSISQVLFGSNEAQFWYSERETDDDPKTAYYLAASKIDAENLMYTQAELLAKQMTALQPQRPKKTDIFFVGFAGYAQQDVFYKEVTFIKQLMDSRFETKGHSINLVNNLATIKETPLATATNLKAVLKQLGQIMDTENDVLILYLTSHGSKRHELSVDFYPLKLNDITPASLKSMLDEAGIKWRVLIISSCYSGGFIPPLQNPTTLLATSSAADRNSFGCDSQADFTYFGKALFQEQLTHEVSLATALENTAKTIKQRESEEKRKFSQPQTSMGTDISIKLNALEPELKHYQCTVEKEHSADC